MNMFLYYKDMYISEV